MTPPPAAGQQQRTRRVVVTPAGRRRYLYLLARHLDAQKHAFDEWHLWVNTSDAADIEYMHRLAQVRPWIRVVTVPGSDPGEGNLNIHRFFPTAADPGTSYVRLDDDVVYLDPAFLDTLFAYREAHPEPFLVYANIINNAVVSHLHQRAGLIKTALGQCGYACMDELGWKNPLFAHDVHASFIGDAANGRIDAWKHFGAHALAAYERVSINAISWLGARFAEFGGAVGRDEELWLSVDAPRSFGTPNVIIADAVCVHYAFHTQRDHLDATDVLARYADLAP
jgi:hypothetical protein